MRLVHLTTASVPQTESDRSLARDQRVAGAAIIASPVLLLVAAGVHPSHRTWDTAIAVATDQQGRWYLGHILVLVALALLVPGVIWLARSARAPHAGLALSGAVLTLVGSFGVAALVGVELVVWEMAEPALDRGEMVALGRQLSESLLILVPLFALLAALATGICLLAAALLRLGTVSRPTAALIGAGLATAIVAFPVPAVRPAGRRGPRAARMAADQRPLLRT